MNTPTEITVALLGGGTVGSQVARLLGESAGDLTARVGVPLRLTGVGVRDTSKVRDGIDASLITGIDPPPEVESALAAINTAHTQVSSDISLAQAAADQKIVQSKRAVEIETLKAQAEIEPLERMATQLESLKQNGSGVLKAYVRNVRMSLFGRSEQAFVEVDS
jgi:hypothetical protein